MNSLQGEAKAEQGPERRLGMDWELPELQGFRRVIREEVVENPMSQEQVSQTQDRKPDRFVYQGYRLLS